ncbi:MAG TPA: hypothetical protein VF729_10765 [Solirubrobacterales bacterium]
MGLIALLPLTQERAEAALYWAHGSSLGRANLDGSLAFWPLPNGYFPALDVSGACGLDVDDQHLYWGDASGGAIGRATIDGAAPDQAFIPGLGAPCGVVATPTHLYWADWGTNLIGRANLDGSGVEAAFVAGASNPCGIAVYDSHVFWANQEAGSIGRADLEGGNVEQAFIGGLGAPCGVDVNANGIYWGDQEFESIGHAALDGSGVEPTLVADAVEPWDVAVNPTHVFWANRWSTPGNPGGGIGRAALDGTGANHDLVPDAYNPTGVALDARLLVSQQAPPRPSDYLRFGKLTRNRETNMLQLIVHVPAPGEFTVDSPAIGWSLDKENPPPWVGGGFHWKLKLWPGKGRAGQRIRGRLRRKGRAPIVLRVTYRQEGRLPLEGTRRLDFLRR